MNEKFNVLVAPKVLINVKTCLEIYKKHEYLGNPILREVLHLSVRNLLGGLNDS